MDHIVGLSNKIGKIKPDKIHHILESGFGCVLEWTVADTKSGEINQHKIKKSESFVRQFLDLLYVTMNVVPEISGYSIRDTGNTVRNISQAYTNLACNAGVGVVTTGIVVGTGAVAPTINDYALGTLIAHGTGGGQLSYGAVTFGLPAYDGTTSQYTITRNFSNSSGGAITVTEVGLYVSGVDPTTTYYFMIIRDVIGGGVSVPNGQTLTINYRPQGVV